MDTAFFKPLITWLHIHPEWGFFLAFLFSFLEGLALIGILIPGTIVMTAAGILAGSGVLPLPYVILWAAIGAFLGDYLSYGLGYYFRDNLKAIWPFKYFPKLIDKGGVFFHKHGGKSIFIGRFIGPVRPVIPLIAGSLKMPAKRFIPVDLLSCILWPPIYMLPGFILGAASLALPPDASTRIIIDLVIALGVLCLIYWFLKLTLSKIIFYMDKWVYNFWQFLKRHPRCTCLYNLLKSTHIPNDHSQLGIALLACVTSGLFLIILISVMTHTGIYHINEPLHHFLRSAYTLKMEKIMLLITYLGNPKSMMFLWGVILAWFCFRKNWYAALHWALVGFLAAGIGEVVKHIVALPRPTGLETIRKGWAFPSGHATMSTAIYSYLAIIIARDRDQYVGYLCYSIAAILAILISFSRIYLGAHWPLDAIGGILLGLSVSLFVALSYRRTHKKLPNLGKFLIVICITLLVLWSHSFFKNFKKNVLGFTPVWSQQIVTEKQWWRHGIHNTPLYRQDRLGKNIQTLNIEWLGSVKKIQLKLEKLGWKKKEESLLLHTIHYFGEKDRNKVLPLFSAIYKGKKPILVMAKYDKTQRKLIILRLWQSHILISGLRHHEPRNLLVGAVSYHKLNHFHLFTNEQKTLAETSSPVPLKLLKAALEKNFTKQKWKLLRYPNIKALSTEEDSGWNGTILLIKAQ